MNKYCPICRNTYSSDRTFCPVDGMRLFEREDHLIGSLLAGRYRLEERIGAGGMALVYKAKVEETRELRAVKVLRPNQSRDTSQRVRFLREARSARVVEHENVVRIHELGETADGTAFIVLEYLDGRTLAKILDEGSMDLKDALLIARQILAALHHAHSIGVLHRDIKAENIMIVEGKGGGRTAKILDFGLAQMKGDLRLTDTGQVFGTPEYISPEQATGEPASAASDQYAAGIVLYEMLTGSPPFKGSPGKVLMAQFKEDAPRPSAAAPDRGIGAELDGIVLTMLDKNPARRYGDLREAIRDLLDVERAL